jgi:tetratricopeptide (TPR) repeat protein
MDKKSLERNHQRIVQLVIDSKLKDALELLKELVILSKRGDFISQNESLDETYRNLLKYAINGVDDPEREHIYHHLQVSVLELADLALHHTYMSDVDKYFYRLKRKIENEPKQIKEEAITSIEKLAFNEELSSVLNKSIEASINQKEEYQNHQNLLIRIFNLIWLTDKFKDNDVALVTSIWKSKNFPWHEQSVMISALTLSVMRCFDVRKFEMLIEFSYHQEDQIRHRALVGLFISLYIHNHRIILYPELLDKIKPFGSDDDYQGYFELIAIQLLKSKDTERITKKFEDEILPEMVKYQPILKDKLDLDSILSNDYTDDKNPDWERVFKDAPDLLDKLQEISKMQMEGADIFMSAFSRLKSFDFFNEIINWFKPFHPDNYVINEILGKEAQHLNVPTFLDGLSRAFFMCNSDKYSFCLNVQYMPDLQKSMMLEMFNAEIESIKELQKEDELLDKSVTVKSINLQYIQDLYRFFKLHPMRTELPEIFNMKLDFYNCPFFRLLVTDERAFQNIGEFFFERNYYDQALEVYLLLNQHGDNSLEVFEKIAFCFQKLKNYSDALNHYKKAELFEANRLWNLKKIAYCNRQLKNYEESLKYYQEAEKLAPDDLYVQTFIGHSYLDLKEYDKALEYYYKVEFLADENKKVLRPIAWCNFLLGKFPEARTYYLRLMESEANKHDFMNLGHLEWCSGDRNAAVKNYKISLSRDDNNLRSFLAAFEEDKKYLTGFGIPEPEINLMLDYLKYMI